MAAKKKKEDPQVTLGEAPKAEPVKPEGQKCAFGELCQRDCVNVPLQDVQSDEGGNLFLPDNGVWPAAKVQLCERHREEWAAVKR